MVGHTGGLPGFGSNWMMLTDYGVGVVSFGNLTYANAAAINMQVLDTLVRILGLKPGAVPVTGILEQRKKELLALLPGWEGAKESGIFAVNFFEDYFLDSLRKEAGAVFEKIGKVVKVGEMRAGNNLRGSFVIQGEMGSAEVRMTLTPENPAMIQEYHIRLIGK
jgi:hypothetical protein